MTVITDPRYWDCECDDNFIHLKSNNLSCSECGMTEDECSDSRPNEIKLYYKNYKEHGIDKNQILEIKEDLKTIKSNRPYLNENQLIAMACAMQDIKSNKLIDFAVVESIYREANS